MRIRTISAGLRSLALAAMASGCGSLAQYNPFPRSELRQTLSPNPLIVPSNDTELVWNRCVQVLDEYFEIAREDRLAGTIITQPKVASTLAEPWAGDSVGFRDRLEASLQTIRRFAQVTVTPAPGGGHEVKVEVYKQLEDLAKPDRQAGSRAVFNNIFPINRTREVVGPVPLPLQWIPRGRDPKLEQVILARIRQDLD